MDLLDEKIKKAVEELKIQTTKKNYTISWVTFSVCIPLALICLVLSTFLGVVVSSLLSFIFILMGIILVVVGITIFCVFRSKAKSIAIKNRRKLMSLGSSLHQYYFENNPQLFPKELKFEGFKTSNVFSNHNCLAFSWNNEEIRWHLTELQEHYKDSTTYILKYCLISSANKFAGFDNIYIAEEKTKTEDSFFESESLNFNERFCVKGNNKIQLYKTFTPKIIENFLDQRGGFLHPRIIWIYDGRVMIQRSGARSGTSWNPDPLDYSAIPWDKMRIVAQIHRKIANDFARFSAIQKLLIPLELY